MIKSILEFKEKDLEPTKSFELKDELNPDIWDELEMKKDIREKLIEISNEFINGMHGTFQVKDIILIGSLASYNWSKYSDFDLHIKIDFNDINEDTELVEDYIKLISRKFNNEFNITIYGYDIEVNIESIDEVKEHVNGIYSILKDKWIKKPTLYDREIDTKLVEEKAINLMELIDSLETLSKKTGDDIEDLIADTNKIWNKIKKSRKDGIASPDGELAIGNLVFKYLRRNDYIGKIIAIKRTIVEKKYSLK